MASGFTTAFANRGTLTLSGSGHTGAIGVVKDVEIVMSAEHVPLYGFGYIARQAVAKHSFKVGVKIGFVKFDPNPTVGIFGAFGGVPGTSLSGTFADSNTVPLFTLTAAFTFEDTQTLTFAVTGIYFPEIPFKAAEGQWVKVDLAGEGSGITVTRGAGT